MDMYNKNYTLQSNFIILKTSSLLFLILLLLGTTGFAQEKTTIPDSAAQQNKISIKDAKEISYQAQATIDGLQSLLNYITFSDNAPSELQDVITNSYKSSRNQIFYKKDIIVEDDINPVEAIGKTKDSPVEKYLNDLDLQYEKTADASISFSNIFISGVKKKEYIYVKVRFDANYASKFKPNGSTYPLRQREALIRLDNTAPNKWQALIVGVSFYDPKNPTEGTDNNMQVATDTSSNASLVSQEDFDRQKQAFILARQEEEKKQKAIFDEYVTGGVAYLNSKQYKEALEMFEKAKDLKPLVPTLDKQIIDAKKLIAENTYENYKSKGDKAKSDRKFKDAILFYNQAIALKPEASSILQPDLTALTQKLAIQSLPNNKLQSADYQGAIDECEKVLHEHKKEKSEYPEIYYIEGAAYQRLAENKPGDTHDLDKALENYNFAIQYFPNYKDARVARALFFVNQKNDFVNAITDYDVLASNELDDSPYKPVYIIAKSKLKDRLQNTAGALEDYASAIALNSKIDSFYFFRGELLYRLKRFDEEKNDFDITIKLNPKYNAAFYYRGLNYNQTNDNFLAGVDFEKAEKLGFVGSQLQTIESISNGFFLKGEELFNNHDFVNADSAYNNAIKIRKCNANAWHGKAQIRFVTAEEFAAKKKLSESKESYLASIDLNKQAITCNANFSDAHFRKGLAQYRIVEYDLAIASYTEAIRSNQNNIQAYMERGITLQTQLNYGKAIGDFSSALILLGPALDTAKRSGDKERINAVINDLSKANQLNGSSQYYTQDYVGALTSLNKAIDFNQNNAEAYYYRGLVDEATNQLSKGIKDYGEAVRATPTYKYYYAEGKANFKNKNFEQSIDNFTNAINMDSLSTLSNRYYLRGLSFFKNKMYDKARNDYEIYQKSPSAKTDTSFYVDYGLADLYVNQDTAAIAHFKTALTLNNNSAKALYGIGCAYSLSKQFDKALEYIEKALATNSLKKDDIKVEDDAFLAQLKDDKPSRTKYNQLKKTYLTN
jgi:tetratricopeptide (TPR) repeat protein